MNRFLEDLREYEPSKGRLTQEMLMKKLCYEAENMVNPMSFRVEELISEAADDPETWKNFILFSMSWVKFWAGAPDFITDERNRISTERCKEVAPFITMSGKEDYFPHMDRGASGMHKTLVQKFSSAAFAALAEEFPEVKKLFDDKYGGYRMPCI